MAAGCINGLATLHVIGFLIGKCTCIGVLLAPDKKEAIKTR